MRRFLARHLDKIIGVIQGLDRIVFRGWLGRLCHESGLLSFFASQKVLLKDFECFAKDLTTMLRDQAQAQAEKLGGMVQYLPSPDISKEGVALRCLKDRGISTGPICILSALEPCMTWQVRRSREHKHPQTLVRKPAKCLHYYHYFLDPSFGLMHVRIQSWLPFQIRVCMNGREWLGRRLDQNRIRYERADNSFPWIANPARAQELIDEMLDLDWPTVLDRFALMANPILDTLSEQLGQSPYWTVWQSEWATDVMFKDSESLAACYPDFVQHAIHDLKSQDVLRFLGQKLARNYKGEVTTDYKKRVEGIRVKHAAKSNSVKMYDKFGRILRIETTINEPGEFKVRRRASGKPESEKKLRPVRRSVVDLRALTRIGSASNHRYLDSLANVTLETPLGKILEPLTRPAELGGRRVRGLRPWAEPDVGLLEAVGRGEFLTNGFRNRDLVPLLFASVPDEPSERRKLSAKVSRLLRLLRAHGLIRKLEGTHRYLVTPEGRTVIAAVLSARNAPLSHLKQCA
jgi:hypothetical protein